MFAKLFDNPKYGQILVKRDVNTEEAPEVRIYFSPPEMGVCSVAFGFADSEDGDKKADKCFYEMDESKAADVVAKAAPEEVWE